MLEEDNALRKRHISELLASAPDCVVPLRAALKEMQKVHHRGCSRSSSDHSKYRVERVKALSVGDNVGYTSSCTDQKPVDVIGSDGIEAILAAFNDQILEPTAGLPESWT